MQEINPPIFDYEWMASKIHSCRNLSKEQLIKSPQDMYLLALSTHKKLPEDLHNAMIIWSHHPEQNFYVKGYLDWIATCDSFRHSRQEFEKRIRLQERFFLITTFLLSTCLVYLLLFK